MTIMKKLLLIISIFLLCIPANAQKKADKVHLYGIGGSVLLMVTADNKVWLMPGSKVMADGRVIFPRQKPHKVVPITLPVPAVKK